MAHPIRPESYIAMDNFYTGTHAHAPHASSPGYLPDAFVVLIGRAFETSRGPVTVYNKGAEVIRMYACPSSPPLATWHAPPRLPWPRGKPLLTPLATCVLSSPPPTW